MEVLRDRLQHLGRPRPDHRLRRGVPAPRSDLVGGRHAAARPVRHRFGGVGTNPQRPVGRHDRRAVGVVRVAHPTRGRRVRRDCDGRHAVPARPEPHGPPRHSGSRLRAPLRGPRDRGPPAQLGALGDRRRGSLRYRLPDQGDRPPVPPDPVLRVGPVGPVVGRDRADQRLDRADRRARRGAVVRAVRVRDRARLPRRDAGLDPAPGRPRDRRARRHRPDRRPDRRGRTRRRASSAPNGSCAASGRSG